MSSEDELLSEHASAKEHADDSGGDGDVKLSIGTCERTEDLDALEHAGDHEGDNVGMLRTATDEHTEDLGAVDHADISDDDDFETLRTGTAELADDLEALVESIAAGTIPDWKGFRSGRGPRPVDIPPGSPHLAFT